MARCNASRIVLGVLGPILLLTGIWYSQVASQQFAFSQAASDVGKIVDGDLKGVQDKYRSAVRSVLDEDVDNYGANRLGHFVVFHSAGQGWFYSAGDDILKKQKELDACAAGDLVCVAKKTKQIERASKSLRAWLAFTLANTPLSVFDDLAHKYRHGKIPETHSLLRAIKSTFTWGGVFTLLRAIALLLAAGAAMVYAYCAPKRSSCLRTLITSPAAFAALSFLLLFVLQLLNSDALDFFGSKRNRMAGLNDGIYVRSSVYWSLVTVALAIAATVFACLAKDPEDEDRVVVVKQQSVYGTYQVAEQQPLVRQQSGYTITTTETTTYAQPVGGYSAQIV